MTIPEERKGMSPTLSFRSRILLIVLALGTIPPLLLGFLEKCPDRTADIQDTTGDLVALQPCEVGEEREARVDGFEGRIAIVVMVSPFLAGP